jgi:hypothetical protein
MRLGTLSRVGVALSVLFLAQSEQAHAQYKGSIKNPPYSYEDPLPILGKKVAARGIEFPLPWGIGLNYMFMQQPVDITNIKLGLNDSEMVDMSGVIKFKSVQSKVHAANLRLDLWLLPFLNVYGMVNYIPKSTTSITLAEPFPLESGATQHVVGEGFGATGAFGIWGAWATLDANWTWNQAELVNGAVRTTLLTPRVGMEVYRWNKVALNLWVGAMAQFIGSETKGAIKLSDALGEPTGALVDKVNTWYGGLPPLQQAAFKPLVDKINEADPGSATVKYELDKKVAQTWNMMLGAQLEINKYWFLRTEVGVIKRTSCLVGLNYRFGTPGFSHKK